MKRFFKYFLFYIAASCTFCCSSNTLSLNKLSVSIKSFTVWQLCITVVWSLPPKCSPIVFNEFFVNALDKNMDIWNGILLRSDLHTLFDLFLISINPIESKVHLSKKLHETTEYGLFHGKEFVFPSTIGVENQNRIDGATCPTSRIKSRVQCSVAIEAGQTIPRRTIDNCKGSSDQRTTVRLYG